MTSTQSKGALEQKAVRGASWAGLSFGVRQVVLLFGTLAMTRPLTTADYGLAAIVLLVASFVEIVQDFGTGSALVQRATVSQKLLSSAFWFNSSIGVGAAIAASMLALALTWIPIEGFRAPHLAPLLHVAGLMFVMSSLTILPRAQLQRELRFKCLARAELASVLGGTSVAVLVAFSGGGVWALLCQPLLGTAILLVMVWASTTWRPRFEYDRGEIRSIRSYGSYLTAFRLLDFCHMQGDYLLIGVVLGKEQLGLYYLAFRVSVFPASAASSAISRVLFPFLVQSKGNPEHARKSLLSILFSLALCVFPMIFGLAAVADVFMVTVCGSKWEETALIIMILTPIALARTIATTTGTIYQAYGRTDKLFFWGVYHNVLVLTAYVVGMRWGIVGVATAYSLTLLFVYPLFRVPMALAGVSMGDLGRALAKPTALCAVMFAAVIAVKGACAPAGASWPCLLLSTGTGIGTYAVLVHVFARGEAASLWRRVVGGRHRTRYAS